MTGSEFRALAHRMADWIADYWERAESLPVRSVAKPGDVMAQLPVSAPEHGEESWEAVFADLDRIILPGLTHWQHPNFYAYFPANASGPAVLGDFLASGLGVQGMLWATSPACTEVEQRMMDWMGEALGLPDRFLFRADGSGGGVIAGTASESTLIAMLAARDRSRRHGGERLVAYASDQAHSSVIKAAIIAGLAKSADDREGVRLIRTDDQHRIDTAALVETMRSDIAAGRRPFFVHATVGTTGVTAVDDVSAAADAVARTTTGTGAAGGVWLHVDAAHAGAACVCPEFRWMLRGLERADSFCFNPHKWLLTNFDCGCLWVADRGAVTESLSITPEYLKNAASDTGGVVDYRDWHIPLGRRFRALKLWFVMRHYGLQGLRAYIRSHIALAAEFESLVRADARFEVASPRTMNLVVFRLRDGDRATRCLMDRVNDSGKAYLTHTVMPRGGPLVLRLAVGGVRTQRCHVRETWELLATLADS
ncbi:MAG: aspartate aminotransferase family protein [Phycisphaerae bacterium]|nr:aspartate aminotransferase family protein [Phycisphaerae bacterium]